MTDGYKIKRILVGTQQVWPEIKILEYDFTTDYHGFSFYNSVNNSFSYGRNSNGLYIYNSSGTYGMVCWSMPSSLYTTQGVLQKIELKHYSTASGNGPGVVDTAVGEMSVMTRVWISYMEKQFSGAASIQYSVAVPTEYVFTIDLANKEFYISTSPSTKGTFTDAEVTSLRNYFTNGGLRLCNMKYSSTGAYSYLQNAKFYIK